MCINQSSLGLRWIGAARIEDRAADDQAAGWHLAGARAAPLLAEHSPGLRAERDGHTKEELNSLPSDDAFLTPRELIGGAATVMPDDAR